MRVCGATFFGLAVDALWELALHAERGVTGVASRRFAAL